jgi:predicted nucleotidyltransferase
MLCIDIIHLIVSYSKPLDVLNIRLLCKDYIQNINYKSIENLFIEKINTVSGFEIDHIFAKNLLTIIKKYKELTISGSIILQILNQENYENSDIDIYCNIKNRGDKAYEELIRYLNKFETLDEVEGFHPTYTIHHWHVKHIRNMNKKIIDIVIMPMSALDKVNNLKELSFCNNYYDGNTLFLSNYNDIINKTGFLEYSISMDKFLDYDYLNDTKLSGFIVRLDKYNKRGFKIKIMLFLNNN